MRGHELRDLAVRARFFIDAQGANVVEKMASPLEVDASGHAHATVTYPSIMDIWPEMHGMDSIRVIEVCVCVCVCVWSPDGVSLLAFPCDFRKKESANGFFLRV